MLPCDRPAIPDIQNDTDLALFMVAQEQALADCATRQAGLAAWVRGQ